MKWDGCYSKCVGHDVLCVDMKSFYASCEAVSRGLDPLTAKLVVVGDINRNGSVVLAASPLMKTAYGIKTGSRLFEVKKIRDSSILVVQARMEHYLRTSKQITTIFQRFVPPHAIHTYSVDESWLTLDGTSRLWGTVWEASMKIQQVIQKETGLIAAIGIGDNKFLAKFVLDVYGKSKGIAEARYKDVERLFHSLPVQKMWGVGPGISKRLNRLNIWTVGDLATADVQSIKREFGVAGERLWLHAWGIDREPVFYDEQHPPPSAFGFFNNDIPGGSMKSIGRGVTLLRDYGKHEDITQVIMDLTHEVCEVLRKRSLECSTVHLAIGYSRKEPIGGFARQMSFRNYQSNDVKEIYEKCLDIFYQNYSDGAIVRAVRVAVSGLAPEQIELAIDEAKLKRRRALEIMDTLNEKLGRGIIRIGSSFLISSIAGARAGKIGGHTK